VVLSSVQEQFYLFKLLRFIFCEDKKKNKEKKKKKKKKNKKKNVWYLLYAEVPQFHGTVETRCS
jgi:hypothetical protein